MKTLERDLCRDCEQTLRASGLLFMKVPLREGEDESEGCAWCKRPRVTRRLRILYDRRK